MNKPQTQTSFAVEKAGSTAPESHILPRNHKAMAKELPEVYYKNSTGSIDRVHRKNLETWFREARLGKPQAQYNLGVVYFKGVGVSTDHEEAFKWFARAAEKGSAPGQVFLGVMYENGLGVVQDYEMSLHWYRKAAEQGHPHAKHFLETTSPDFEPNVEDLYKKGQYFFEQREYEEAFLWLSRSAEQDHLPAIGALHKLEYSLKV